MTADRMIRESRSSTVLRPLCRSTPPPNLAAPRHSASCPGTSTDRPLHAVLRFYAPAEPLPLAPHSATRSIDPASPRRRPRRRQLRHHRREPHRREHPPDRRRILGSPSAADDAHRSAGTATRRSRTPAPAALPTSTSAGDLDAVGLVLAERGRDCAALDEPQHRRLPSDRSRTRLPAESGSVDPGTHCFRSTSTSQGGMHRPTSAKGARMKGG